MRFHFSITHAGTSSGKLAHKLGLHILIVAKGNEENDWEHGGNGKEIVNH